MSLAFLLHIILTSIKIIVDSRADVFYYLDRNRMGFQQTFKALSDPTRRDILRLLRDGPLPAGEIAAHFAVSGATISHHLAILRDAGLILDDKRGKFIYYELNLSVVDEILGWLSSLKGDEPK